MSYIINLTDGTVLTTVQDGTLNTQTGLNLIGRNYTSYGDAQNENFVKLLENFADTVNPVESSSALTPLTGTLWYDTGNNLLKVYDGANWYPVSQRIVANTAPTADNIGDQWWDSVNQQLNSWNGSSWTLVGPAHTLGQGLSGAIVEKVYDTVGNAHIVVSTYISNTRIAITSQDTAFTINANASAAGFTTISPGINLTSTALLTGTATNSQTVGNINPTSFARVDQNSAFAHDVSVAGNLVLTTANIYYANNGLSAHNHAYQGNIDLKVNSASGNITALHIDGNSGLATVFNDPVTNLGVATKQYTDAAVANMVVEVQNVANEFYANIEALQVDYLANVNIINTAIASTNSNLTATHALIDSNVTALSTLVAGEFVAATANAATLQGEINAINTYLTNEIPLLANVNSPVLTGRPTTPNPPNLITYLTEISSLNYWIDLTSPLNVNQGDYLVQVEPVNYIVVANVRVVTSANATSNVTVQEIGGTVTNNNTYLIFQNGTLTAAHFGNSGPTGTLPTFLGLNDSSNMVASTLYVDATANLLYGDYDAKISSALSLSESYTNTATAPKANIASPVFTGAPQAPTPPGGDNSANIATTSFVGNAISSTQFNYSVATTLPGDTSGAISSTNNYAGNSGDFWFQVGQGS
jgi:hypothetical protein